MLQYLFLIFYISALPAIAEIDKSHYRECLLEMLADMFGSESVSKLIKGDKMTVTVDGKVATIDLSTLSVKCEEDEQFQQMVNTAVSKLQQAITPVTVESQAKKGK